MKNALLLVVLAGCNGGSGGDSVVLIDQGIPGDGAPDDGAADGGARCDPACDDGDPCSEDVCEDGTCRSSPRVCDDGVQCTTDACEPGPICPDGQAPVEGVCRSVLRRPPQDAAAAFEACTALGAEPVVIADADANTAWRARADEVCGPQVGLFLALRPDADDFRWASGDLAEFSAWEEGQPAALEGPTHVELAPGGGWRVAAGPVVCFACEGPPQPFACTAKRSESDELAVPEVCNGDDDDCDGDTDEDREDTLCDDQNVCTLDGCDGPAGCVHYEPVGQCVDDVDCTVDGCDPVTGCVFVPDNARCDDGVACTADTCSAEGCSFRPDDGACDDGIPCTADLCDPVLGCVHEPIDAECNDRVACTADACVVGVGCENTPQNAACEDDDVCTDDVCDPRGGCENPFNSAPCDDGEICTPIDRCVEGVCTGQETLRCDDGLPCTADQCAPGVGCVAPPQDQCDHPGPLAGYFVGTFTGSGEVRPAIAPDVVWNASGSISAVVDAALEPSFQGFGEGQMAYDIPVLFDARIENVQPGRMSGAIGENGILGFIHVAQVSAPWNPTYVYDDAGVLIEISGETVGTVSTRSVLNSVVGDNFLINLWAGASPPESPYRFQGTLRRVLLEGSCCAPDGGCEPSTDLACHRKGWRFAPTDAGRCCQGEVCAARSQIECDNLGGTFVAARQGACCEVGGTTCNEGGDTLCAHLGGSHQTALSCEDANADGLADGCGAPEGFGYTQPPGCMLSPDRRRLTTRVGDLFDLELEGNWVAQGTDFTTLGNAGLVTDLGTIPLLDASVRVGCGDRFSLLGTVGSVPDLGVLGAWPGVEIEAETRQFSLGYAYGYEMRGEPTNLEGPFADGRPYLFVAAQDGYQANLGPNVRIVADEGDEFTLAVDPLDPAFILEAGGERLLRATGNLVKSVGLGLSRGGHLTWRARRDLPSPEGPSRPVITGHIWRSGEFALIPIPGLPGNLFVDGEVLVDIGAAVDHLQPVAEALFTGESDVLAQSLVAAGDPQAVADVLQGLRIGGNVNALTLNLGPVEFTVGEGAFTLADDRISFSGTGFTPGAALAAGGAGELFEGFSAIVLQATGAVEGFVDGDHFRVAVEADLVAGPFALRDARLILDSVDGIRIEGGRFAFDFGAFLRQIEQVLDCDFAEDGATCRFAGVEIGRLSGELNDQGFRLAARLRLGVFNEIEFGATVQDNGAFTLEGRYENGIPGLQTQGVRFQISQAGVAMQTGWAQFGQRIDLAGSLTLDGRFTLTGSGGIEVRSFQAARVDVTVDSRTGITATGRMTVLPAQAGAGEASFTLTVPFNSPAWVFSGSADLAPFGYRLAEVRIEARGNDGLPGLELSGVVGIEDANVRLTGNVTPGRFAISGTANLRFRGIGLDTTTVTLDSTGLRLAGGLNFGFFEAAVAGAIGTSGDFELCTNGRVGVPFAGLNLRFEGCLVRTSVVFGRPIRVPVLYAHGNAAVRFAGIDFNGNFALRPGAPPEFSASIEIDQGFEVGDLEGRVSLSLQNGSLAASFSGEACIEVYYVFGSEDVCIGAGGSVNSSGEVCVDFPWPAGRQCLDIL